MIKPLTELEMQKLAELCQKFIKDQTIGCAEYVYQTDCVILNAYELIENICDIVGYYEEDEDE